MDFINSVISSIGLLPTILCAGVIGLLVYSVLKGGKGGKGGSSSSGSATPPPTA